MARCASNTVLGGDLEKVIEKDDRWSIDKYKYTEVSRACVCNVTYNYKVIQKRCEPPTDFLLLFLQKCP